MLKSMISNFIFGRKVVLFAINNTCNCKCEMCSIWKDKNKRVVKFEDAKKALIKLRKNNFGTLQITGGEPLLHPDVFRIIQYAKKLGFNTVIYQNAKISSYKKSWKSIFDVFEFFISFNTRISKIPIYYGKKGMDIIIEALEKKIPPLVLINLEPISGENIFHWIVVTGINKDNIIFNDPDISEKPRKDVQVKKEIFEKSIATDNFSNITFPFSMFANSFLYLAS